MKIKSMWITYESSWRILFPEGATTTGSEVFESPIDVNYLQPELHRDKNRTLAVKSFLFWSLTLDPIQSIKIWTYKPLPTYDHLLVENHHSNVR